MYRQVIGLWVITTQSHSPRNSIGLQQGAAKGEPGRAQAHLKVGCALIIKSVYLNTTVKYSNKTVKLEQSVQ